MSVVDGELKIKEKKRKRKEKEKEGEGRGKRYQEKGYQFYIIFCM
jgi:hypothetical protein